MTPFRYGERENIRYQKGNSEVEEVTSEKSKYDSPVCEYRVRRNREIDLAEFLTKNCDQIKSTIPHFFNKYSKYGVVYINFSCTVI